MKNMMIRNIPEDQHRKMKMVAACQDKSMNDLALEALAQYLIGQVDELNIYLQNGLCKKCGRPMHQFHDCELNPVANP